LQRRWYWRVAAYYNGMRLSPQEKGLAEAVTALAATITELINERLREQSAAATATAPAVAERTGESFITMGELLQRVRVGRVVYFCIHRP
jgi:hypothetical protein